MCIAETLNRFAAGCRFAFEVLPPFKAAGGSGQFDAARSFAASAARVDDPSTQCLF